MQKRLRVLIAESNLMYCDLIRNAFGATNNQFQIVASVSSIAETVTALEESKPDVAVISVNLRDGHLVGLHVLPQIRTISPDTRTLLVLESSDRDVVIQAFLLGADGVFCRDQPFELLCRSVEAISRGEIWANTAELLYVLDAFVNSSNQRKLAPKAAKHMTKSESAVVSLAVNGLPNREIAAQLGLTEHTVKNYLYRVFNKLGVSNRVELALLCLNPQDTAPEASTNRALDFPVRPMTQSISAFYS